MDKIYTIFFFLLTIKLDTDVPSWKWITYRTKRNFSIFPGVFHPSENANFRFLLHSEAETKWLELVGCLAIEIRDNLNTSILIDHINMTSFEPQNKIMTKIKLYGTNTKTQIVDVNAWDDIDVCCSALCNFT